MKKKKMLDPKVDFGREINNLIRGGNGDDETIATYVARFTADEEASNKQGVTVDKKLKLNQQEDGKPAESKGVTANADIEPKGESSDGQDAKLNALTGEQVVENGKEKAQNASATSLDAGTKVEKGDKKEDALPPFVTYGGDVTIKENDNIFYYKTRYRFLTATFKLVGKFDSKGRYIVADDVKRELIKIVKEIESVSEDEYKASISYFGKEFRFVVKMVALEDGKSKATLYLEEYVGKALKEEYIVTKIADYVDKNDDEFRIKVRKVFSLSDVALVINEFEVPNLTVIMQNALDIDLVVGDLFDIASQIYLLRLLKLLEETPEGREIIAKYKSLLDGSENNFERKFTYLRMILERVIDDNGGFENLKLKKEDKKKLTDDLLLSIQNLKKQAKDQGTPVVEAQNKVADKKAPAPKAPAKKPAKKPEKKGKKPKKPEKKKAKKAEKAKDGSPIVFYIDGDKTEPSKTAGKSGSDKPSGEGKKPETKTPAPTKGTPETMEKTLDFDIDVTDGKKSTAFEFEELELERE